MYVEVKNLSKTIGGANILTEINMEARRGCVTGLRGVNGSGKTMLLRAIAGLIKPTSGEIVINGKRLWHEIVFPESIGVLIENPAFLDSYSGFNNLKMIAQIKGIANAGRIRTVIDLVGLDPDNKKKFRKYSLGMKQRLGIACAVLESSDLILLDEPTNALDANGVDMLKRLIVKEKERGAVIIITCHDPEIMAELADVTYLLEEGRVASCTPTTLKVSL